MACISCSSANIVKFTSETMIHHTGAKFLAHPDVLVFPKLLVCFDCGVSQFTLSEGELGQLGKGPPAG
jgi:hypothetical protein